MDVPGVGLCHPAIPLFHLFFVILETILRGFRESERERHTYIIMLFYFHFFCWIFMKDKDMWLINYYYNYYYMYIYIDMICVVRFWSRGRLLCRRALTLTVKFTYFNPKIAILWIFFFACRCWWFSIHVAIGCLVTAGRRGGPPTRIITTPSFHPLVQIVLSILARCNFC